MPEDAAKKVAKSGLGVDAAPTERAARPYRREALSYDAKAGALASRRGRPKPAGLTISTPRKPVCFRSWTPTVSRKRKQKEAQRAKFMALAHHKSHPEVRFYDCRAGGLLASRYGR